MSLSIGCSIALYHVSSNELVRSARRSIGVTRGVLGTADLQNYNAQRLRQLEEDKSHLKINLTIFNFIVLGIGGGISYALARRTMEPIEEALEAQRRFSADASHELRTPLTAMRSEIEVGLRNKNLSKSEAVELLKSNLEEVDKLKSLSEGLLSLAHDDKRPKQTSKAKLKTALDEALKPISKLASAKKIKIDNQAKNLSLKIDHDKLKELLIILLDNAIKYSPSGSQITVTSKPVGKMGQVSIADQGLGIKASELPRIFERFYRSDSSRTKDQAGGYGLGLAIAKKNIENYGGVIQVKSTLAKGSTFSISLPRA